MHNHNNKDGGHSGMLWMMIPCLLLLGFLLFGGGKLSSSGYFWPVFIGGFIAVHIWMMWRGHGGHGDSDENRKDDASEQPETKDEHKGQKHGCCH